MPELKELIINGPNRNHKYKEMIYKSFYGYLMGVILRYTGNRDDAEELVNDTFIKIFKNIEKFNSDKGGKEYEMAFKGWISKIGSRTAIDFLRTKKSHLSVDIDSEPLTPAVASEALSKLNVKDILILLNALPAMQRIVFNMYEIEGYSHLEISKIMNIPESSSRVNLTRAKSKLRELYNTLTTSYATT